jgi:hypothetical protein
VRAKEGPSSSRSSNPGEMFLPGLLSSPEAAEEAIVTLQRSCNAASNPLNPKGGNATSRYRIRNSRRRFVIIKVVWQGPLY